MTSDIEGAGGRVARYGELFVWEYYTEEKGWFIVRELSMNEKICVALIYDGGYFSKTNEKAKKSKFNYRTIGKSFLRKSRKQAKKEKTAPKEVLSAEKTKVEERETTTV